MQLQTCPGTSWYPRSDWTPCKQGSCSCLTLRTLPSARGRSNYEVKKSIYNDYLVHPPDINVLLILSCTPLPCRLVLSPLLGQTQTAARQTSSKPGCRHLSLGSGLLLNIIQHHGVHHQCPVCGSPDEIWMFCNYIKSPSHQTALPTSCFQRALELTPWEWWEWSYLK